MNDDQKPLNEATKEEVIVAIVQAVGNPFAAKDEIAPALKTMYDKFIADGQTQNAEIIGVTWDVVNHMQRAVGVAVDVAAAAKEAIRTIEEDRDEYAEKWMDLEGAVRQIDTDNPLVETLVESVEADKEALMRMTKFVSDYPGFDMVTNGDLEVDESDAQSFHMMLFGDWKLTAEEKADLSEYITDFVNMVRDREAFQKRQREAAARKQAS